MSPSTSAEKIARTSPSKYSSMYLSAVATDRAGAPTRRIGSSPAAAISSTGTALRK